MDSLLSLNSEKNREGNILSQSSEFNNFSISESKKEKCLSKKVITSDSPLDKGNLKLKKKVFIGFELMCLFPLLVDYVTKQLILFQTPGLYSGSHGDKLPVKIFIPND
jgi:hypothetical protein